QALVGIVNCGANTAEKIQALSYRKRVFIAILRDGQAVVDQFHHEVRKSFTGGGAIQNSGDVGVIETGQNLALVPETDRSEFETEFGPDDFQRHLLSILSVGATRGVDSPHAANCNFP